MSINKSPTEGGSGGKRGHSNMEHWEYTEEIKKSTKTLRRKNSKEIIRNDIKDYQEKDPSD